MTVLPASWAPFAWQRQMPVMAGLVAEERIAADGDPDAVAELTDDTPPCVRRDGSGLVTVLDLAIRGGRDDGVRHGMFRGTFHRCCKRDHVVAGLALAGDVLHVRAVPGAHGGDLRPPVGQRAGLVECHRAHVGQAVELGAALHQDAEVGKPREAADHRHGDADHQRAGAGDDEQREAAIQPAVSAVGGFEQRLAEREHRQGHDQAGEQHDGRRVIPGEAVDKALRRAALRLGLLDEPRDAGDGGISRPGG